jgi:hypothetical protein
VLVTKSRALCMLHKPSSPELHLQPCLFSWDRACSVAHAGLKLVILQLALLHHHTHLALFLKFKFQIVDSI